MILRRKIRVSLAATCLFQSLRVLDWLLGDEDLRTIEVIGQCGLFVILISGHSDNVPKYVIEARCFLSGITEAC